MSRSLQHRPPYLYAIVAVVGLSLFAALLAAPKKQSPAALAGPLPTTTSKPPAGREEATFAAGCFWSMEAIFKQLKGVDKVEPGYAGGKVARPSYEQVEEGDTGHAETINITFDPKVISYSKLLEVLLTVRDPTTLNRQGPDEGTQYRSVIFTHDAKQAAAARAAIGKVTKAKVWKNPLVVVVTPFSNFYRAEDYHLDYYNLHPDQPYCKQVVKPEIDEFREKFRADLKPPAAAAK